MPFRLLLVITGITIKYFQFLFSIIFCHVLTMRVYGDSQSLPRGCSVYIRFKSLKVHSNWTGNSFSRSNKAVTTILLDNSFSVFFTSLKSMNIRWNHYCMVQIQTYTLHTDLTNGNTVISCKELIKLWIRYLILTKKFNTSQNELCRIQIWMPNKCVSLTVTVTLTLAEWVRPLYETHVCCSVLSLVYHTMFIIKTI